MSKTEHAPALPKPKTLADLGIVLDRACDADSLQSYPQLASMVMAYITHLSELDFKLECAALVAIGGGRGFAEALLAGMKPLEHEHRRKAIQGILKTNARLSVSEIKELFSGISEARKLRNDFAHGLWWTHSQVPDALILTPSHKELLRFGVGLDTVRSEPMRAAVIEFIRELAFGNGLPPPHFGSAVEKLVAYLKSPWDIAFSEQTRSASSEEALERESWFERHPDQNIDWSKVIRADEKPAAKKSEILAMGGEVHSDSTIWDAEILDQALSYARHITKKPQALTERLLQAVSSGP